MTKPYSTRALASLSLSDLHAFLGNAYSRKLAHNTYIRRDGDALVIRFHATDILTFHGDGSFTVRSGGWESVTTKQRLNALLPLGYRIFSKRYAWYISTPEGTFPFESGDRWNQPQPQHDRVNGHYGGFGCGCPIPARNTCTTPHASWLYCGPGCYVPAPFAGEVA